MPKDEPLFQIEFTVEEHLTKENADPKKQDVFTVTLKSTAGGLYVGMEEAKAMLKIKAFDDIIKHRLPKQHAFIAKIYPLTKSADVEQRPTTSTTLDEAPK